MTDAPQGSKPGAKTASGRLRSRGAQWLLRVGMQCAALLLTFVVGVALVGIAQRIGWIRVVEVENVTNSASEKKSSSRYICPMACVPPQSVPGKCSKCGMELQEVGGDSGSGERTVSIDAAARRILGIRTAKAQFGEVFRTIRTVGEIDYDQQRVSMISAYVDGRIETLFAEYVGVKVAQGDALALLYSPMLYSAQVEYLSSLQTPALNALSGGSERLSEVALDNLAELGMTPKQIDALRTSGKAQKRLRIVSPLGGTVIAKHKIEGDYVKTGEPIYRVVDLSMVWLMLDLYPSDAAAVRFGQQVEAEIQSLPGEVFTGRVAFVDPMVNKKTRTVAVRVEMTNFNGRLKPGDYTSATIRVPAVPREQVYDPTLAKKWISPMHPEILRSEPGQCPICGMDLVPTSKMGFADDPLPEQPIISVPRSAILMAGNNSVAYVETEPGVFELREVSIGAMTENSAVVLNGIAAGESVATDGNFLIDSQMQLGGKPSLIDPGRAKGSKASTQPQRAHHAH